MLQVDHWRASSNEKGEALVDSLVQQSALKRRLDETMVELQQERMKRHKTTEEIRVLRAHFGIPDDMATSELATLPRHLIPFPQSVMDRVHNVVRDLVG